MHSRTAVQLEARTHPGDPWKVAAVLPILAGTMVACAEEAERAKDDISRRAHLTEARKAGHKFSRLAGSARRPPSDRERVSE